MEKLAQLKEAEVCGVLSALVDKGLLPVNSPKQFEKVAAYMSNAVEGYDYSLVDLVGAAEDALKKTAAEDGEKPARNKRDLYAGIGAGVGVASGVNLGTNLMDYLHRSGWVRQPKSALARILLMGGAGAFMGVPSMRGGKKGMEYLYDLTHKNNNTEE